ncbi:hypothetical protein GRI40_03380 [Altererythrobacter aerius]|uniref:Uncharacterized protein n=1 Tax=Tsuneonella aeria TaxID=1837929 RepID=A0A6I4TBY4_9SPHN|nr:hypothetical protein [Tsuneonella aeria]MXO74264.1 hypothetical protein [Tsuneonella aeria]
MLPRPSPAILPAAILPVAMLVVAVAACRPPASDGYVQRIDMAQQARGPRVEMTSPATDDAVWADSREPGRIVFGQPGHRPLLSIACTGSGENVFVEVTRYAQTDPRAQGMMALVGNGHVVRLKIDAADSGRGWLWRGRYQAIDPRLDALTGARRLELTIPGAGTLVLQGSPRPGALIEACRRIATPVRNRGAQEHPPPM